MHTTNISFYSLWMIGLIWGLYAESHWIVLFFVMWLYCTVRYCKSSVLKGYSPLLSCFPSFSSLSLLSSLIFPSLAPFALLFRPVQGLITFIMVSIRATEYRVIKVENRERETDTEPVIHDRQTEQKSWRTELYRSERERRSQWESDAFTRRGKDTSISSANNF